MARRAEYLGPERRRPLVLDAALEIFAEGGFADASMSAIAERASVSKAVLYDCFPGGKQEIFHALHERVEQEFMNHMLTVVDRTNRLPLEQALTEGLTAFLDYAEVNPNGFRILFDEAGTADPTIARHVEHGRERIIAKMGERTYQILRDSGLPVTPAAAVYNRAIVAVADELARWTLRQPDLPREQLVRAVVTWFMKGFEQIVPRSAWLTPTQP